MRIFDILLPLCYKKTFVIHSGSDHSMSQLILVPLRLSLSQHRMCLVSKNP